MKNLFLPVILFVILLLSSSGYGQTTGTLTFTVKTVAYGGEYSPKHVLAIWIKDFSGNFVKTRKKRANVPNFQSKLVKWLPNSGGNVVDATTGASLTSHQEHTVTWNCSNVSGNLVADGNYQVWVEFTEDNSTSSSPGPSYSLTFTKGPTAQHLTPGNTTYFQNIDLLWTPDATSSEATENAEIMLNYFPNPFSSLINFQISIPAPYEVNMHIYNSEGKIVAGLINDYLQPGRYYVQWDGTDLSGMRLPAGIYYCIIGCADKYQFFKILLAE